MTMKSARIMFVDSIKSFFMNILQFASTRIQLIWFTSFCWATSHIYFGIIVPLVREVSIIFYRQNSIIAPAINMDSTHASAIMNSMDIAFAGTVLSYVASSWAKYKNQTDPNVPKEG